MPAGKSRIVFSRGLWPAMAASMTLVGCAAATPTLVRGQAVLPTMHLTLTLPEEDAWEMQQAKNNAVVFVSKKAPGIIGVWMAEVKGVEDALVTLPPNPLFAQFKKWTTTDSRFAIVAGAQGIVRDAAVEFEGKPFKLRSCVFMRGNRAFELTLWALEKDFKRAAECFEPLVASLAFVDAR